MKKLLNDSTSSSSLLHNNIANAQQQQQQCQHYSPGNFYVARFPPTLENWSDLGCFLTCIFQNDDGRVRGVEGGGRRKKHGKIIFHFSTKKGVILHVDEMEIDVDDGRAVDCTISNVIVHCQWQLMKSLLL
jgi:hypothetical protein